MSRRAASTADLVIGQNLRRVRKHSGVSIMQLCEFLDISQQQLNKYERGLNRLPVNRLVLLAGYLRVPVKDFFAGVGAADGAELPAGDHRDLLSDFGTLPRQHQEALCVFVRSIAAGAGET